MKPLLLAATLLLAGPAAAATYIPASDAEIVTTLPAAKDPQRQAIQRLRRQMAARPGDAAGAAQLAQHYIELSRRQGDPRYLGQAEAVLQPWLTRSHVPADIWLLQGTIQQSQHRFEAALQSLQRAADQDPRNPQVWLTLASIYQVRGNFAAARNACGRLAGTLGPAEAADCLAGVDSVTGRAHEAMQHWQQRLAGNLLENWAVPWLQVQLAETSQRLGQLQQAAQWFERAMQTEPDSYLKAAYADFLLQQGQPAKVVTLLQGDTHVDALLLRLAEAHRALRSPNTAGLAQQLQQRFDAARARGEQLHQREEARLQLNLLGNATKALQLAQANWHFQKEPADARLLLQAALAARQPAAAQVAVRWLMESGHEDRTSWQLASRL